MQGLFYDQGRNTALLTTLVNPDTARDFSTMWEWDGPGTCGKTVSQIVYPQPRSLYGNTIIYFAKRGSVLFHGGFTYCSSQTFTDTWEYMLDSDGDGVADAVDCLPTTRASIQRHRSSAMGRTTTATIPSGPQFQPGRPTSTGTDTASAMETVMTTI